MSEEMRQNRILEAAEQRFLIDGFERSTVDAIAADARVSKREIYRDWPSKADLFAAVALRTFPEIHLAPITLENQENAHIKLQSLAEQLHAMFSAERNRNFFRTTIAASRYFPELISDLHQSRVQSWADYSAYFERLASTGIIHRPSAAAMAIRFGSIAVEGAFFLFGFPPPSPRARQQYARAVTHVFFGGWEQSQRAFADENIEPELQLATTVDLPNDIMPKPTMRLSTERFAMLREALWNEFLAHGYPRANLNRASTSVGVSKATVYRQFGSKEGVFSYLASDAISALQYISWRHHVPSGAGFAADLTALMQAMMDCHMEPKMLACQRILVEEATNFPQLSRAFYVAQLLNTQYALSTLCRHYDKSEPNPILVRLFYVLATFGSRFFMTFPVTTKENKSAILHEAITLFLHGAAQDNGGSTQVG